MEDNNELIPETGHALDAAEEKREPKKETVLPDGVGSDAAEPKERPESDGEEPKEQPEARSAEKKPGAKKRRTVRLLIALAAVAALAVLAVVWIVPAASYAIGNGRFEKGDYAGAYRAFHLAGDYKNANKRAGISRRANAFALGEAAFEAGDYATAVEYYSEAAGHEGAESRKALAELGVKYSDGQALMEEGKYAEAIGKFSAAGSFPGAEAALKDAQAKLADRQFGEGSYYAAARNYAEIGETDSVLECGKALIAAGKYADAIDALELTEDESFEPWRLLALYYFDAAAGDHENAVNALLAAGDLPEAAAELPGAYYALGSQMMDEERYADAQKAYTNAGSYSDAEEMVTLSTFMKAEDFYDKGYLNSAKAAYEALPSDYGRDGVTAGERLKTLDQYKAYLAICGEWRASSGNNRIETRETYSSGYYYYWYEEPGSGSGSITVTCRIGDDGKVTISGTAKFKRYTNYDDDYYDLKTDTQSFNFSKTVSSPGAALGSGVTTLNYSGGRFKLHYQSKDQSKTYVTYTYTCDYVYDTRTKAY